MFFDTHCHIQDKRYGTQTCAVIERAGKAGVCHMVCCATNESDWEAVLRLAQKHVSVIPAFGMHPWYLDGIRPGWEKRLEHYLLHVPSAIGECGLDFTAKNVNRSLQEEVLMNQLLIARRLDRPIQLHCRKAWQRLIAIVKDSGLRPSRGMIHSFSGTAEMVPHMESLGLYISFSGSITRKSNIRGPRAIKAVSENRLLIETDSPDIIPSDKWRPGEPNLNEPSYLPSIAQKAALAREVALEQFTLQVYANAQNLFKGVIG